MRAGLEILSEDVFLPNGSAWNGKRVLRIRTKWFTSSTPLVTPPLPFSWKLDTILPSKVNQHGPHVEVFRKASSPGKVSYTNLFRIIMWSVISWREAMSKIAIAKRVRSDLKSPGKEQFWVQMYVNACNPVKFGKCFQRKNAGSVNTKGE